jgi:hypothetical protein
MGDAGDILALQERGGAMESAGGHEKHPGEFAPLEPAVEVAESNKAGCGAPAGPGMDILFLPVID